MAELPESDSDLSNESSGGDLTLYELARWRFDQQLNQIDALDRKLAATFTLNGALIALLAAAFTFRGETVSGVVWWLIVGVVLVFLANALCAFMAFRLRRWVVRPDIDAFENVASDVGLVTARIWLAREIWTAYQQNEPPVSRKARWLRWATTLTMLDLALASVTAIAATWPW